MITTIHPRPARTGGGAFTPITDGLAAVRLSIVNVCLVGPPGAGDRGWALVDAGLFTSTDRILDAAASRFGPEARPAAIILTHGHFDHVGALPELAERWAAPIYAHELELPYLTGRSAYPPPDPAVGGGGMSLLSRLYPRGPIDLRSAGLSPLPADGSVPGMPGWRWVHTPGHTPGHISLFRESDRALIAGDAFVTTAQESLWQALLQPRHVWRPPAYYTADWAAAHDSIQRLAALEPEIAITGHGAAMSGGVLRRQLRDLADHFRAFMPQRGRYINRPAITDATGVRAVPPPVADVQLRAVLATAAAIGLGALLVRQSSRPSVPHGNPPTPSRRPRSARTRSMHCA